MCPQIRVTPVKQFAVCFGEDMVYINNDLAEDLFQKLDEALHEPTMTNQYMKDELDEKEDRIFTIQDDLDVAKDEIERLRDNLYAS